MRGLLKTRENRNVRMLRKTALVASVLSAALVAGSASASVSAAEPSPPKPWLKKMVDRAVELAKRKVEPDTPAEEAWQKDASSIINEMMDWDEMTQRSLGRQWKDLKEPERKEFSSLLRELIEASYKSKLKLAARGDVKKPAKIDIDWLEEKVKKNKATVAARVKGDKRKALLEFSLLWSGDRWQVYDVAIDDVSTVRTYRSQFRRMISDKGFPALLERMRGKLREIREGRADLAP